MRQNVTFSIGNLAVIDKANADYGFFEDILGNLAGKADSFLPSIKLLIYNRLGECHSLLRLPEFTPLELIERLGGKKLLTERTLNRNLSRLGKKDVFVVENYQQFVVKHKLVDNTQHIDFSSIYFEGSKCSMGKLGYSRDHEPGKLQITFGISVGGNKMPTALTIQKGNVVDKKHMKSMLKLCKYVLAPESITIFDCGGNTKENKRKIRKLGFHYLTLKPKRKKAYKELVQIFGQHEPEKIEMNGETYLCVKIWKDGEWVYIFYSEKLKNDQLEIKRVKFARKLAKGDALLKKVKKGKELKPQISREGWIVTKGCLQRTLEKVRNPFVIGIEGFFALECSQDLEPATALMLYKDRDKAEKLIRDMKEGAETRPVRHWSRDAVVGYMLVVFLTNALINLTLLSAKNPLVKNLKLLKKYLKNSTLTVVYPKNRFRFSVAANISAENRALLGDFIENYGEKELGLRW